MPPNAKIVNACKAMENMGYTDKVVKPVLKMLLKLYENNWMLIEEDNYQVLVDTILDSEEQKARCDEAEENEPPLKRSKLSSQERHSSTSFYASMPNSSYEVENQPHGSQKLPEPIYEKQKDKDIELQEPRVSNYCQGKGKSSSSPPSLVEVEQAKRTIFVTDDEGDKSDSMVISTHMEESGSTSDIRNDFSEKRMIVYESGKHTLSSKESSKLCDEHITLEENESGQHQHEAARECEPMSSDLPSFGVSPGNNSEPMDFEQSEADEKENDAQEFLKLVVASSSRGQVNICLTDKSSQKSDSHVPSIEAVLKQVEEQCIKSYEIPQTGFSILRLMKDVCECFLAAGTTSTYTEDVRPTDVVSSLGIFNDTDSEAGPAEGIDHQLSLCPTISNDSVKIQNLFKFSPQIPRFLESIELDLSRCKIFLNVERNAMVLNSRLPSSSRMMIVHKSFYHYISDITKGQEAYEISLINELNGEQGPAFNYIPRNMTYQNAYTSFLVAHVTEDNCGSIGDSLSQEVPCECEGKTRHEFAYTLGFLLKEEFLDNAISTKYSAQPHDLFYCEDCSTERCRGIISSCKCNGHIMRNFVKECWNQCGCSIKCRNRVVQRGITAKLQVFRTPGEKDWGLRTLEDIQKGAFICEYVGEVITCREAFERYIQNTGNKHTYSVPLDADWNSNGGLRDEQALCLDATVHGNVARFINHRCLDANLVEIPVEVETPDHNYYHLAFFTRRKVNALEELTWDYGIDFYRQVKAFQCLCGSKFCRDHKSLKKRLTLGE